MSRNEPVDLDDCTVVKVLPNSLLVHYEGEEIQIPFSLIQDGSDLDDSSERDDSGLIIVPFWLAEDRGVA